MDVETKRVKEEKVGEVPKELVGEHEELRLKTLHIEGLQRELEIECSEHKTLYLRFWEKLKNSLGVDQHREYHFKIDPETLDVYDMPPEEPELPEAIKKLFRLK